MMTIEQLRAAHTAAVERLHQAREAIDDAPDDADLDPLEQGLTEAADEVERTRGNLEHRERIERIAADNPLETDRGQADARAFATARGSLRSELIYRPDTPRVSFFRDAYRSERLHDFAASERLARNSREQADIIREQYAEERQGQEFRDVGTGAFAGLVVPQYLVDLVAPLARAGSPLINALPFKQQLPEEGMTVNISRITTGSGVAAQATENAGVQETDMDDTLLTVDVRTHAGMQDVSRQLLERGAAGTDDVIYRDLVLAYWTTLDSAIINGAGTSGTILGIRSTSGIVAVTYTDATPTVPELFPKGADAVQQIETAIFRPPFIWVMHPRRWGWMTAALDTTNRPLVVPNSNGPFNALAVGEAPAYGQVVGTWHGMPVITDANLPTNLGAGTNEDVILAEHTPELFLWWEGDGMPRQLRFEQVAPPQSVRLAVWGYAAFSAGRYPGASATIGGTGLVTPTF